MEKNAKKKITKKNVDEEIINQLKSEITNKVKEQVTQEIITNIKNDVSVLVKNEVSDELNKELSKKIKKENKRILRGKRGKILRRDFTIVLLLCIICYLLYYMYNHNYVSFSINSNVNNKEIINDKKGIKEEDYTDLFDKVNVKLPFYNSNSLYLYTSNYDETNINDSIKLTMAYNSLLKDKFEETELKNAYINLFGTDKNYHNVSFDYECKHFDYDATNNEYSITSDSCIDIQNKEIIEKIIKTEKKENQLIFTTVVGVYDKKNKSLYTYKNIYDPIAVNLNSNFDISNYKSKLTTHKYIFTLKKGEYYFTKIVKL